MDPQLVLMLAGGTLLLLNGFIGTSGRGSSTSQGDLPEQTFSSEFAYERADDRATLVDGVSPVSPVRAGDDGDLREA